MSHFTTYILYALTALRAVCFALPAARLERRDVCFWNGPVDGTFGCEPVYEDKLISSIEFSLYRYPEVPADSAYIEHINSVLDELSPVYTSFLGGTSLGVSIHMVDRYDADADTSQGDETYASTVTPVQHCYIRIATNKATGPMPEDTFKSTMAHELYHCIQDRVGPFLPDSSILSAYQHAKWRVEGSADFMGYYFYPEATTGLYANDYDPTKSITDKSNAYPAWIIFQYLVNSGWTPEQVNAFVVTQPRTYSVEAEWSLIAANPDLVAAWPHFATNFVDNTIKRRDGSVITPLRTVPIESVILPDATTYEQQIPIRFFQIQRWKTTLPADKTVTLTFTPDVPLSDSRTILQYRRGTSISWQSAPLGQPFTLQSGCQTAQEPWEFLVTSTNDPASLPTGTTPHAKLSFAISTPSQKRQDGGLEACEEPPATDPTSPPVASGGDLSTCLVGTWKMDLAAMQQLLTTKLASVTDSPGTVSNLQVTGSSSLSITPEFHSVMKMEPVTISYDLVSPEAGNMHTDINIAGSVEGEIVPGAEAESFSWALGAVAEGSVKTVTRVEALGVEVPLDFPVGDQYGAETVVSYVCEGDGLRMEGYWDGGYVWAYEWVRV